MEDCGESGGPDQEIVIDYVLSCFVCYSAFVRGFLCFLFSFDSWSGFLTLRYRG